MRPDKYHYYLGIAKEVSKRSPCLRRKFGAVIVVDDAIVSTGYNGPARGVINCDEVGCAKDLKGVPHYEGYGVCPAVHAEENAVINAARNGVRIKDGDLYIYGETPNGEPTPSHPCDRCRRVLINAGISDVITMDTEGDVIVYEVEKWIDEDTKKYLKLIGELKDE